MRGRMNDAKSYSAPFALDAALDGGAVGEVIASRSADRIVGDTVVHQLGWREYAVLDAGATTPARTDLAPASAFLGALGMTGLTAYAGLLKVAEFKPGDAVFVSGAAGAVGSLVGQIAKAKGASRVIGSAGTPEKVARLLELGFDAAFDYHDGPVRDLLKRGRRGAGHRRLLRQRRRRAPRGGAVGAQRRRPRRHVRRHRAVQLHRAAGRRRGTSSLAIGKQLTLKGFLVGGHWQYMGEFVEKMSGWLADGTVRYDETIVDGLENAPQAFMDLLDGANTGKMLVRI